MHKKYFYSFEPILGPKNLVPVKTNISNKSSLIDMMKKRSLKTKISTVFYAKTGKENTSMNIFLKILRICNI